MNSKCNFSTCRYNENGICKNEEKRKECVEVSKMVLCLEDSKNEKSKMEIKCEKCGKPQSKNE